MTLGGLTIAIGALVDDAIIDVENVLRRLREKRATTRERARRACATIVLDASLEVRSSILFATLVIALVFAAALRPAGHRRPACSGRSASPTSPALAGVAPRVADAHPRALPPAPAARQLARSRRAAAAARRSSGATCRSSSGALRSPVADRSRSVALALPRRARAPAAARPQLPARVQRGVADRRGGGAARAPRSPTPTRSAARSRRRCSPSRRSSRPRRRTGRAERDEHVQGAQRLGDGGRAASRAVRKQELLAEMRRAVATIPGVVVTFGQPISHRIDHMLSGSKSNLAVKIFGPELGDAALARRPGRGGAAGVPGIVDLSNQEQAAVPQLVFDLDRAAMARHGLSAARRRRATSRRSSRARRPPSWSRTASLRASSCAIPSACGPIATALGRPADGDAGRGSAAALGGGAGALRPRPRPGATRERRSAWRCSRRTSPAPISRGTVERARAAVDAAVELPPGYRVVFGGQFEEAAQLDAESGRPRACSCSLATWALLWLAFREPSSGRDRARQPAAGAGRRRRGALASGGTISVASIVGFVTLFGIATRNGVLLVSRYRDLAVEGVAVDEAVRAARSTAWLRC